MGGLEPDAALLARVRSGQVGGIILFRANVSDAVQIRALTGRLQSAALAAGRPPLLVAIDQEGGAVKRLPWLPPTLSPPEI
jgi:beta-N-acetylhexosaminidase